ncbi:MAG: hypothetical protein WCC12_23655, partial [Anaerolineales bacterium]
MFVTGIGMTSGTGLKLDRGLVGYDSRGTRGSCGSRRTGWANRSCRASWSGTGSQDEAASKNQRA